MNQTFPSLHVGSLVITQTVPSRKQTNGKIISEYNYLQIIFNSQNKMGGRKKDVENLNSLPKGILKVILVFYTVVSMT